MTDQFAKMLSQAFEDGEDERPMVKEFGDGLSAPDRAEAILDAIIAAKGGSRRAGQVQMARNVAGNLSAQIPYMPQAGTGTGKALDIDTPIPTPTGFVRMGDLKVGDLVFNEEGLPVRITRAFDYLYGRTCYLVTFSDGTAIVADEEHLWDTQLLGVLRGDADPWAGAQTRTTKEIAETILTTNDVPLHRIPVTRPLQIEDDGRERPVSPYILGAWLAGLRPDGKASFCTSTNLARKNLLVRIPGRDESVRVGAIDGPPRRVEITPSEHVMRGLRALGALSPDARIPEAYIFAPEQDRRALMAGLLDVAGYVVSGSSQVRFSDHRYDVVEDFAALAASLGYRVSMSPRADRGSIWVASFSTSDHVFGLRAKNDCLIPRARRSTRRTIVSVVQVESRTVRCITVDSPRSLFLAGRSMVPTHNSIAYLAGALASGRQVVIAPHTKALQDQLKADLDLIASAFPEGKEDNVIPTPTYAIIKGRSSYLCLRKVKGDDEEDAEEQESLLEGLGAAFSRLPGSGLGSEVKALGEWADVTTTGERSHLPFSVSAKAWRQVSVGADKCTKKACPFYGQCFAEKPRRSARKADIIVVNQALLAVWMKFPAILPSTVGAIVVDEAHEFPSVVADAFGARVTHGRIKQTISRARAALERNGGGEKSESIAQDANRHNDALDAKLVMNDRRKSVDMTLPGKCSSEIREVASSLAQLNQRVDAYVDEATAQAEAKKNLLKGEISNLLSDLQQIEQGRDAEHVVWAERGYKDKVTLRSAQFDVSATIFESLVRRVRSVVFTSATLAIANDFSITAANFGFARGPWRAGFIESPFDYKSQGLIWTPRGMPSPSGTDRTKTENYQRAVAIVAEHAARAAGGRTLVLCTSNATVKVVAEHLRDTLGGEFPVLEQGGDETPKELAIRFAEDPKTVLVGTRTFWTGISIEGDTCAAVVLDKVPFPTPSDPVIKARSEKADMEQGKGAGFRTVSIAEACLTLVQGAGRLIRTVRDRGVIVLCDPRIHPDGPEKKSYGAGLLGSLPPFPVTDNTERALDMLREIDRTADDTRAAVEIETEEGE